MTLAQVTEFFGWMVVLNIGYLVIATLAVAFARDAMARMHSRMFGVATDTLNQTYFSFIATYKIAVIVFCLVPYLALVMMG